MKRREAYITQNWRNEGICELYIVRIVDDGNVTGAMFLIDSRCPEHSVSGRRTVFYY